MTEGGVARGDERVHRREARGGVFRERARDEPFDLGRRGDARRGERGRLRRDVSLHLRGEALGAKGRVAREHLVERHGEGVLVRGGADAVVPPLLGGHVRRRSDGGAGGGDARRVGEVAGHAEVDEPRRLTLPITHEEHVLGLHVAVDHTRRVGRREGLCDGPREAPRRPLGERAARVEERPQRAPFELREHEVGATVIGHTVIEDVEHRGVREARQGVELAFEAPDPTGVVGERTAQHLEHHRAARSDGVVDRRGAALGELGARHVRPRAHRSSCGQKKRCRLNSPSSGQAGHETIQPVLPGASFSFVGSGGRRVIFTS